MRRARLFLLGLVLVSLVEAARQWNSAPGRVPSHFDAAGRPNAWSSRDEFFFLQVGVTLGIAALFIGLPWLLRSTPASLINLPNKSYWLAPERREESLRYLNAHGKRLACLIVMMMLGMHYVILKANHMQPPTLPLSTFSPILVGFCVALVWWIIRLYRRFPKAKT